MQASGAPRRGNYTHVFFTLPWRGRVDANEMSGGVG
jgi:hypothetical protein